VKSAQLQREGKELSKEDESKLKQRIIENYEQESSCYYSSARLWDDGVILPQDTRKVLGLSVMIASNRIEETKHGVFRM
jgi:3-methylcrotonyl-CoA carboxylase beta subunit